uniref:Dephospho-CoA kinase n=1 Tax=candidate division WOR-3 bacterium TaxID=2052148 RepID=A0A7C2P0W9_UNCW3
MSKVVIITGKAGTGKTTVANILRKYGFYVLDVDSLAHSLLQNFKDDIIREFGNEVLSSDGIIDRKKLGEVVFKDPQKISKLERILHPTLEKRVKEMVEDREGDIFIDVAIPKKLSLYAIADFTIVVTSPQELVEERLRKKGWPEEKIKAVIGWQREECPEGRYYLVPNIGTFEELERKILSILKMEGLLDGKD